PRRRRRSTTSRRGWPHSWPRAASGSTGWLRDRSGLRCRSRTVSRRRPYPISGKTQPWAERDRRRSWHRPTSSSPPPNRATSSARPSTSTAANPLPESSAVGLLPPGDPALGTRVVRLHRLAAGQIRRLTHPLAQQIGHLVHPVAPLSEFEAEHRTGLGIETARIGRQSLGDLRMRVPDLIAAGGEVEPDVLAADIGAQGLEVQVPPDPVRSPIFVHTF